MKKYNKVVRQGQRGTHLTIQEGSKVIIMEKLDGANASFKKENGILKCFSSIIRTSLGRTGVTYM